MECDQHGAETCAEAVLQAASNAEAGHCAEAETFLAGNHAGLVVNEAVSRPYVKMAAIAKTCGNPQQADGFMRKAATSKMRADAGWANQAQRLLGAYDPKEGKQNLEASLAAAQRVKDASAFTGWWWYNIGIMQAALDCKDQAREAFRNALLLPDSMMSHHLSREAIADLGSGK